MTKAATDSIRKNFPGAMKNDEVERLIAEKLIEMGFTKENTLFADSSCPDEICHDDPDEDLTFLFQRRWGEVFPLAGLAGLPFVGKTGWEAFTSRCPRDGNVVVLFAPHVGIDGDGNVGSIKRKGQKEATKACGAAIGAYKALINDQESGNFQNGYADYQMDTIKHLLKPHCKYVSQQSNAISILTYKMYDIIHNFLNQVIDLQWQTQHSKLAVVGGIMLNCEGQRTDMFLPLTFEIRTK